MSNGKPRYQKDPSMYACKRCKYPMRPKGIDCPNCGLNKSAVYPPVGGGKRRSPRPQPQPQRQVPQQPQPQPQPPQQRPIPQRQSPPIQQPQPQVQQNFGGHQQGQGGGRGGNNNQFPIFDQAPRVKPKQFSLKNGANQKLHFTGENVVLNRGNLDPTSRYIAPNQHATICFRNGKWYLKGSGSGATYVEVKGDMQINNGDKIIFGNKFFTFEAND